MNEMNKAQFTPPTRQDCPVSSGLCELNSRQLKTAGDRKFWNWTCSEYLRTVLLA